MLEKLRNPWHWRDEKNLLETCNNPSQKYGDIYPLSADYPIWTHQHDLNLTFEHSKVDEWPINLKVFQWNPPLFLERKTWYQKKNTQLTPLQPPNKKHN